MAGLLKAMPYTISHVAAVMPAHRWLARRRVFPAAVIGSMVPDFGMLLPGDLARWQTHSLAALFSFCLPVGLGTYWLTQWLIRPAVLEVVPDGAYVRLRAAAPAGPWTSLRAWLLVTIALLFGALTHLIWDGFTHENARGVRLFPQLLDYGPEMAGHSLRLYDWLQDGSSVVGLAVVAVAVWLWLRHTPAPHLRPQRRLGARERRCWLLAYALLPLAALALMVLWPPSLGLAPLSWKTLLMRSGLASVRAAALSLLLISAAIRARLLV